MSIALGRFLAFGVMFVVVVLLGVWLMSIDQSLPPGHTVKFCSPVYGSRALQAYICDKDGVCRPMEDVK